jgi:hypothetical protein
MAENLESILVADCGSVATKVGLIDRVGETYRLLGHSIAATTTEPPFADVLAGLRRAIAQLETASGRRLLTEDGNLITPERVSGQGVDAFVATTTAALPLRVAVLGLSHDISLTSALRAVRSTFAVTTTTLALDQLGVGGQRTEDRRQTTDGGAGAVQALAAAKPEVIVLAGGIDGGALAPVLELGNIASLACAAAEENARPCIVFAGNRDARPLLAERLARWGELRVVDNVRPTLTTENRRPLEDELERIYAERKIAQLPNYAGLAAWSPTRIMPTPASLEYVARFLARRYGLNVIAVNIGASATSVVSVRNEAVMRSMGAELGVGYGIERMIAQVGLERIARWLPVEMSLTEMHARLLNQGLRPWSQPVEIADARLIQAAVRESLAWTLEPWCRGEEDISGNADLILVSGAPITRGVNPGALTLEVLDGLQTHGIFSIAVDWMGLASVLGAVAALNPQAAAEVTEHDGFVTLGTVIAPLTSGRDGQTALSVRVISASGQRLEVEVRHGELELIPLGLNERAQVEIRARRGVDLGPRARGGVLKREMQGGALGLLIDARGRPVRLPDNAEKRRAKLQSWLWDVGETNA